MTHEQLVGMTHEQLVQYDRELKAELGCTCPEKENYELPDPTKRVTIPTASGPPPPPPERPPASSDPDRLNFSTIGGVAPPSDPIEEAIRAELSEWDEAHRG